MLKHPNVNLGISNQSLFIAGTVNWQSIFYSPTPHPPPPTPPPPLNSVDDDQFLLRFPFKPRYPPKTLFLPPPKRTVPDLFSDKLLKGMRWG